MTSLRRAVPAPLLSVVLFTLWLLLARGTDAGQVAIGLLLAITIPLLTVNLRLPHVRVRRPGLILRYVITVGVDVTLSNLAVWRDVLRWRWRRPDAKFVIVPLELRDPVGLATLSLVTTIVPGTVWSELAVDGSALLLHVWDVPEEAGFVARFKARYEQPLREIFE